MLYASFAKLKGVCAKAVDRAINGAINGAMRGRRSMAGQTPGDLCLRGGFGA
jgi:hypothetical protein